MQLIDKTSFEPLIARSPQHMYAASALASMALGFGAAALASRAIAGKHSRLARANGALSFLCGSMAMSLRLLARQVPTIASEPTVPLADKNSAGSIDYSIIIPVYNRPDEIRTLLHSLSAIGAASLGFGTGEVIVVDDGSTDDTVAAVRSLIPEMSLLTRVIPKTNGGVSSARNAGFAHARGEIGIVIDSDCIPESSWLSSMLSAVQSDPSLLVFARIRSGKRPAYPLENLPDCKGFVGASFAMNRASYLALGGCYERYGASHDDRDLVLTALAHGHDVAHATDGWITHPLRRETLQSMWRVGLNSRFGNLFALRHGVYAARGTRPTPYYFFGVGSNYGSSIGFIVAGINLMLGVFFYFIGDSSQRKRLLAIGMPATFALATIYVVSLTTLGVLTGTSPRDLPKYAATLGTFQFSTLIGRLQGAFEYGIVLL